MEELVLAQHGLDIEDWLKYGFIALIFFGSVLAKGAKVIIDAINKKQSEGKSDPTTRARPLTPPMEGGTASRPPMARPLPQRTERSSQVPVARPFPGARRPSVRQEPLQTDVLPPAPVMAELVPDERARKTTIHIEPVTRSTVRRPSEAPRPPHELHNKPPRYPKPDNRKRQSRKLRKKRTTSQERLGHLHPEDRIHPEDHVLSSKLRRQVSSDIKKSSDSVLYRGVGKSLRGGLSHVAVLRQAIVMSEILAPPLALRSTDQTDPWGS